MKTNLFSRQFTPGSNLQYGDSCHLGRNLSMLFLSFICFAGSAAPTHAAGSHPPPNTGQWVCHDNP